MCQFLSFAVSKDGKKVYASDLRSHTGIERENDLDPEDYREAEWTTNSPHSLTVRTLDPYYSDHSQSWYKASILGVFPTRDKLINYFLTKNFIDDLDLGSSEITKLPPKLKVGGSLDLSYTKITKIPVGLKVERHLNLSGAKITKLPPKFRVNGYLNLYGSSINKLPNGLKVGGDLNLSYTKITKLPPKLEVWGNLDLTNTKITKLPKGLQVGGKLTLIGTKINEVPKRFWGKTII